MKNMMAELRKKVKVGLVGGSDFVKIQEQMGGGDGESKLIKTLSLYGNPAIKYTVFTHESY